MKSLIYPLSMEELDVAKTLAKLLWSFEEFMTNENVSIVQPIIEGLLSSEEFILLSATAKSGKTWLAMHLAKCIFKGEKFLNVYPTKMGRVVYIENELATGRLKERFNGMNIRDSIGDKASSSDNFFVLKEKYNLQNSEAKTNLMTILTLLKPNVVIIDPLFCMHNADENVAREMLPILQFIRSISNQIISKPAVVLIHHVGKRGEYSGGQTSHMPRGSSVLADVPDAIWNLARSGKSDLRVLSIEQRYGPPIEPIEMRFRPETSDWEVVGSAMPNSLSKGSAIELHRLLETFGGPVGKAKLQKSFCEKFDCSPRTFDEKLSEAISSKLVIRKQHGKNATFESHSTFADLQVSIESCEVANVFGS